MGGRPDPVSCQLCRSKKLKCNRVQPCSNCSARGVTCSFLVPPQKPVESTSVRDNDAGLLERIKRLESIMLRPPSAETLVTPSSDDGHLTRRPDPTPSSGALRDATSEIRDKDSQLLENIGTREDFLVCGLLSRFTSYDYLTDVVSSVACLMA